MSNALIRGSLPCTLAAFALAFVCAGCATFSRSPGKAENPESSLESIALPEEAGPDTVVSEERFERKFIFSPMDVFDVIVDKHPEATRACTVRPDGYITLPLIDDIHVAGMTPEEVDDAITKLYSSRFANPEVSVIVTGMKPQLVYVIGAVVQQRAVALQEAPTVIQAISSAGGFTNRAKKRDVVLIRQTDTGHLEATRIEMEVGKGAQLYADLLTVPLQQDDLIYVPKTRIGKMTEFFNESLSPVLSTFNSILNTYSNIKLVQVLNDNNGN